MIGSTLELCSICNQIVCDPLCHDGNYYCPDCDPYKECTSCKSLSKVRDSITLLCPNCLAKAKECCHCKKLKPLTDYYKQKTSPDGHRRNCKVCATEASNNSRHTRGATIKAHSILAEQQNELAEYKEQLTSLRTQLAEQKIQLTELRDVLVSAGFIA